MMGRWEYGTLPSPSALTVSQSLKLITSKGNLFPCSDSHIEGCPKDFWKSKQTKWNYDNTVVKYLNWNLHHFMLFYHLHCE